jgi:hypothetical protein
MATITNLDAVRRSSIQDLMNNLSVVRGSADSAHKRLAALAAGQPITKEERILLATELLLTLPETIEPMRSLGVLLSEDVENAAVEEMEKDLVTLTDLWFTEKERAAAAGESPRQVSHAGYLFGPEVGPEC